MALTDPLLQQTTVMDDESETESDTEDASRGSIISIVARVLIAIGVFSFLTWLLLGKLVLATLTVHWESSCPNLPLLNDCTNIKALGVAACIWVLWILIVGPIAMILGTSLQSWTINPAILDRVPTSEGEIHPLNAIIAICSAAVVPQIGIGIIHFAYPLDKSSLVLTLIAFSFTTVPFGARVLCPKYLPQQHRSSPNPLRGVLVRVFISYICTLWHAAFVLTSWTYIADTATSWLDLPSSMYHMAPISIWALPTIPSLLYTLTAMECGGWLAGLCSLEASYIVSDWTRRPCHGRVVSSCSRIWHFSFLGMYWITVTITTFVKVIVLMGHLHGIFHGVTNPDQYSSQLLWIRAVVATCSLFALVLQVVAVGSWQVLVSPDLLAQKLHGSQDDGCNGNRMVSEEDRSSIVSRYTFWWMWPILKKANLNGSLDLDELPHLPKRDLPENLYENLISKFFHSSTFRINQDGSITKPSAWKLLSSLCFTIQSPVFLYSFLHGWLFLACMLMDPILLGRLLEQHQEHTTNSSSLSFVGDELGGRIMGTPVWEQLGLVLLLTLSMFIRVACQEVTYFGSVRTMNNARSALVHTIFCKALHMGSIPPTMHETSAPTEKSKRVVYDAGKLTNLIATDADSLGKSPWVIFFVAQWTWAVVSLPIVVYFMHQLVGNAAFAGAGTIFLTGYASRLIGNYIRPVQKRVQEKRDERSKCMKGMLSSIKMVKLEACEEVWAHRVKLVREKEMQHIKSKSYLSTLNLLVGSILTISTPVAVFMWYTFIDGHELDSRTAFTTLAWINQMNWSINTLPHMYNLYATLSPSCSRVLDLMLHGGKHALDFIHKGGTNTDSEIDQVPLEADSAHLQSSLASSNEASHQDVAFQQHQHNAEHLVVDLRNGIVGYGREAQVLRDVNLSVVRGETLVVIGPVGSGKSTLLATLAKALPLLAGTFTVSTSRAYTEQRPFLLNDTVRENILFGLDYDPERYKEALQRSALEADVASWDKGDLIAVGDSGVQLSGGQQARVALARAMYADADVYFFDDILSAVDATTGRHIWDNCIGELKRRGKSVVLVTHQIQYLEEDCVDRVVLLSRTSAQTQDSISDANHEPAYKIDRIEKWEQIKSNTNVTRMLQNSEPKRKPRDNNEQQVNVVANEQQVPEHHHVHDNMLVTVGECQSYVRQAMMTFQGRRVTGELVDRLCARMRGLDERETKHQGVIAWEDFMFYVNAFGSYTMNTWLFLFVIAGAGANVASNVWLSVWSDSNNSKDTSSSGGNSGLFVYAGIGLTGAIVVSTQSIMVIWCSLRASGLIHENILAKILELPLSFFDSNSVGLVLNRFLQDLQTIDTILPNAMMDQIAATLSILTQLSVIIMFAPWVLFAVPLLGIPYTFVFSNVRVAARDAKRLESIAHSPVYGLFGDVVKGGATIRSFGAEERFKEKNLQLVNNMARGMYSSESVIKWSQALTAQTGVLWYSVCGLTCVALSNVGLMSTGQMGLVLLYAATLQRAVMDYMASLTTLETRFVAAERLAELSRLSSEEELHSRDREIYVQTSCSTNSYNEGDMWPTLGNIQIQNVTMRYRLFRPSVLSNLNLNIAGGAKVAICGRSGCGKSTLFSLLTRLYPISRGTVLIDGVDIATVRLNTLRQVIRMVSQDAILISGTVRENLTLQFSGTNLSDERHQVEQIPDAMIWDTLRSVYLEDVVKRMPLGLDTQVMEGGENLSVGERSLLATARALLPRPGCGVPKIILCDEPTANIDLETDEKVHNVLLSPRATVVFICHRLQHIKKFDQVVVMGNGNILEQGSPSALMSNPASALSKLKAKAGLLPSNH